MLKSHVPLPSSSTSHVPVPSIATSHVPVPSIATSQVPVPSHVSSQVPSGDKIVNTHVIPSTYQEFSYIFSKKEADLLSNHSNYDIAIDLDEGAKPPFGPLYSLSNDESKVLKDYIDEYLKKGFIRPSTSPAGAPVLFVKKEDASLRLCVD